jgi:hypothetical protein
MLSSDPLFIEKVREIVGADRPALAREAAAVSPALPTRSSWINMVERWFGLLTERQLRRGAHRSTIALDAAIEKYISVTNEQPKPFAWTKSADETLALRDSAGGLRLRTLA